MILIILTSLVLFILLMAIMAWQTSTASSIDWKQVFRSRFTILLLSCGLIFGASVGYDFPATVVDYLKGSDKTGLNQIQFNLLYSIYSLPNIVLPLLCGSFIQRFGLSVVMFVLCGFIMASGLLTSLALSDGIHVDLFPMLLFSRFLLGLGGESLNIVQSSIVARYFIGTDLSFALATTMSVSRLYSVLDYNIIPVIAEYQGGVWTASLYPLFACFISVMCALGIYYGVFGGSSATSNRLSSLKAKTSLADDMPQALEEDYRDHVQLLTPLTQRPRNFINRNLRPVTSLSSAAEQAELRSPPLKISATARQTWYQYLIPAQVSAMPQNFWLTVVMLICYSSATINFLPLAPLLLHAKYYPDDKIKATALVSLPDTISVLLMPLIGYFSDKSSAATSSSSQRSQTKIYYCIASGVFVSMAHLLFAFSWSVGPEVILIILGVGYAGYGANIYSLMAEIVNNNDLEETIPTANEDLSTVRRPSTGASLVSSIAVPLTPSSQRQDDGMLATAYGISGSVTNLAFALVPLIIGYLILDPHSSTDIEVTHDQGSEYFKMEIFFSVSGLLGLLTCLVLLNNIKQSQRN